MSQPIHLRAAFRRPSWRQRMGVLAGVLLLIFASVQQASHSHGARVSRELLKAGVHAALTPAPAGGEADCPLCVAMHSASPARQVLPVRVLAAAFVPAATVVDGFAASRPVFALFSRPPPAALLS